MSDSWQDLFSTWKGRMAFLYGKTHMTDCKFIFGEGENKQEIRLHKMVLGSCSTEFFNLWFMCEAIDNDDILIRDVSREALIAFVYYLYNETVELNMDIIWDVMKLSKLYGVKSLMNFCGTFLKNVITNSNLFLIWDKILTYGLDDVQNQCLYRWSRATARIYNFSTFNTISQEILRKLFAVDDFPGTGQEIYTAVNKWIEKQYEIRQIEKSVENKKLIFGNCVFGTKFNEMIGEYLINPNGNDVVPLLKRKNIVDIMKDYDKILKFEHLDKCSIFFSLNETVIFHGFYIFGKTTQSVERISFFLKDNRSGYSLVEGNSQLQYDGTPKKYKILLKNPFVLAMNIEYELGIQNVGPGEQFCGTDYNIESFPYFNYRGAKLIRAVVLEN